MSAGISLAHDQIDHPTNLIPLQPWLSILFHRQEVPERVITQIYRV